MTRPLAALPKAHLHLHFTGAMRHPTLVELARDRRIHLPEALSSAWPPRLSGTDERGWFRFQRLYDIARSVLTDEPAVFRLLRETAEDEQADGSGWLEIQVDPSGYAGRFGGLTPTVELVLAAARAASAATGVGIGVVIAANRTKHPLEARTLARLAAQYVGRGVTGFGAEQRRAPRGGPRLRRRVPDRGPGRPAAHAAWRGARRARQRPVLPGRPAGPPDRPRRRRRGRPRSYETPGG
jgi:adenosine deaminase